MIRCYCNWCGGECDPRDRVNGTGGRTTSNGGYLFGKGPTIEVSAHISTKAKDIDSDAHICARCLGKAIRGFLLGESVEAP